MKNLTKLLLATVLFIVTVMIPATVNADDQSSQPFTLQKVPTVGLGNGNYVEINNVSTIPEDNGNLVSITVTYYNKGNFDLQTIDYMLRLKSSNSSKDSYATRTAPEDANINRIPAGSNVTMSYYSRVGPEFKVNNFIIDIVTWDFDAVDYEKILGSIKINGDDFTVPANRSYELLLSGKTLETEVVKTIISKNEKFYNVTAILKIRNNGRTSIVLPELQYSILTSEGIIYPLQPNNVTEMKIDPRTDKEITLRGSIPSEIKETNWKLIIAIQTSDAKLVLPKASYSLPKSTQESGTDFSKEFTFSNINGLYNLKVNSITRTPLDDQDLISASMLITNKNDQPLPVPALTGKFVLDGSIERNGTIIQPNKVVAIQPNESIIVHMYCEIPYTYEFQNLKLVLQEQINDQVKDTLLEISGDNVFTPIPLIQKGQSYAIDNVGNSSTYKIRDIKSYNSITSKTFTVQIEVSNNEKRSAGLIPFIGYFTTSEGYIFPANVTEIKEKMIPGGKALLEVSTTMPIHYNTDQATLILGESVKIENQNAGSDLAYVNPVEYQLGTERDPQIGVKNIDVYPYTLTFEKIRSQIIYGEDKIQIDFNYQLDKDALVLSNSADKKIVIEIMDEENNISFMNEYSLEGSEHEGSALKLGYHSGRFTAVDNDLIFKIKRMNNDYTFNVYEQVSPGYKKLLATQKIRWFSTAP